jgi:hypothetical protein
MKKQWCVREGIFEGENGLWWLNKEVERDERTKTPMAVALRNGDISKVIDVRFGGLSTMERRRGL